LGTQACRGDRPRTEATPGFAEAPRPPDGGPETEAPKEPKAQAKTASVLAPWLLTVENNSGYGVRIDSMDIRGFAAPLLEPGDVVIAVDGRPVHSVEGSERYLRSVSPGAMVVFTLLRNQRTIDYAMLQMPDTGAKPPATWGGQGEQPGGGCPRVCRSVQSQFGNLRSRRLLVERSKPRDEANPIPCISQRVPLLLPD
jgi:hypothetical protein